ncbi:MAG: alpha/beta hydrolase-fold protein [Ignavibacteriaceae bacterium]
MKKLLLHLIYFIYLVPCLAQTKVTIEVISQLSNDTAKVYITGNTENLGNWDPGRITLTKVNDSTWCRTFLFNNNQEIEFKFTQGSWDTEALDKNYKVLSNNIVKVESDSTISYRINEWSSIKPLNKSGQITGKVVYHQNLYFQDLLPRDIIVWLPPGYDSSLQKRFPVLYMHDGQNIIDPKTSAFGIDWQMDETADSLIENKLIEEMIIIGIYNTSKRRSEYDNTIDGNNYLKFIVEHLKPFIDNNYRTLPDKINTATAGSSLGGLISFLLIWQYPDVFSKAACISPAFKIENIDVVTLVKNYGGAHKDLHIYIDNGGKGLEEQLQPGIDEMISALGEQGYKEGENLIYFKDDNAEHNETAWAIRAHKFLEKFFPYKKND